MDRLENIREHIDPILRDNPNPEESRCGFMHLYGVSTICTLLALRRGLDPQLCSVAGMLHDIWNYQVGDSPEHGSLGAVEAGKLLQQVGGFSQDEIDRICQAIARHGDKQAVGDELDELLKDADVLQHYLYNPEQYQSALSHHMSRDYTDTSSRIHRLVKVLAELGIPATSGPAGFLPPFGT